MRSDSKSTRLYFAIPLFIAGAFLLFSAITGFRFSPDQERFWIIAWPLSTTDEYYILGTACVVLSLVILLRKPRP